MNEKNYDKLFEDYHRNIAENEGLLDDSLYSRFLQEMNKEKIENQKPLQIIPHLSLCLTIVNS